MHSAPTFPKNSLLLRRVGFAQDRHPFTRHPGLPRVFFHGLDFSTSFSFRITSESWPEHTLDVPPLCKSHPFHYSFECLRLLLLANYFNDDRPQNFSQPPISIYFERRNLANSFRHSISPAFNTLQTSDLRDPSPRGFVSWCKHIFVIALSRKTWPPPPALPPKTSVTIFSQR